MSKKINKGFYLKYYLEAFLKMILIIILKTNLIDKDNANSIINVS